MNVLQLPVGATQEIADEDEDFQYLGYVKGNIVGLRYYDGMVSNKEMVALVREPQNPYDRNAVRVNNIMGQQVGHIKREMAKALTEVVDQGLATIEGLVPYGSNNVYSMAVEISFWGNIVNRDRTVNIMRRHRYQLLTEHPKAQKSQGGSGNRQLYTAPKSRATRITSDQMKNELDGLFEKLREVDQSAEEDGCPAIRSKLYKHQRQAVGWMRQREGGDVLPPFWEERKPTAKNAAKAQGQTIYYNTVTNFSMAKEPTRVKGGILADDMGLGKTLITISLILGNSWNGKPIHKLVSGGIASYDLKEECGTKTEETVVLDSNKEKNISLEPIVIEDVKVEEDIVELPQKEIPKVVDAEQKQAECVASFIVTKTNANEATEGRRSRRATKRPARYVDEPEIWDNEEEEKEEKKSTKKTRRNKTKSKAAKENEEYIPTEESKAQVSDFHHSNEPIKIEKKKDDILMEFEREPVPASSPHTTLIICPLSVIGNWVGQIEEHVHANANVNILVYHGPAKSQATGKILASQDIVVTTYQTLAQEMKRSPNSLLLKMNWLRVVLDEGHVIRNPKAQQTKACNMLKTERKWILTGTPIQNSTKDLFAIVAFLGIEPFTARQWWSRTIERPLKDGDASALKRIRCLLGAICMRRTKKQKIDGKPIINMPPKEIFMQTIELDAKERELYDKMDRASKQAMRNYASDGLQLTHYANMLVLIMRLRQICCHPVLAKKALEDLTTGGVITKEAKELATKLLCMLEAGSVDDCCICLDSVTMPVITKCSHVFCNLCICGVIANNNRNWIPARCPLCRSDVKEEDLVEPLTENEEGDEAESVNSDQQSSKVLALMYELLKLDVEKPSVKSLVVSQFTEYLKLIQHHLVASNIPCVLYHGGMTRKARENAIWQLQSGEAKVMLMTLKAGGVGLNLTAASQVFLMEPSWNPAAEDQCFDRVYRLGQTKPVRIVKFVCSNTVEERMLELQARKRELANASLQRQTPEERKQRTVDDLRRLMDC